MKTRILAGVTAAVLVIALLFLGPISLILSVVLLCSVLAYLEFDRLFFKASQIPRQIGMAVMIMLEIVALHQDFQLAFFLIWIFFSALGISHVFLASKEGDFGSSVHHISLEVLAFLYCSSLFGFILPIIEFNPAYGRAYLFLLFLLVFLGDTAAYFAGRKFGKHTLASEISPKKTVEGAAAAVVTSLITVGLWLKFIYPGELDFGLVWRMLLLAPIISIVAQLGDLFESVMKRAQSKKDSGSFLPGHGGILDRIDGLAFSAPIYFLYLHYILEHA